MDYRGRAVRLVLTPICDHALALRVIGADPSRQNQHLDGLLEGL